MLRPVIFFVFAVSIPAKAEVESEIPFGIETVTGFRTDLVDRGFKLGEDVIDVQIQSELVLNEVWTLGIGAFHATASGAASYEESRGFLEIFRDHHALRYGWHAAYRDVSSDIWRDGLETGPFFSYAIADDVKADVKLLYDHGAEGFYTEANLAWSHVLSEKAFLTLEGGAGVVMDYYGRDGLHDIHTRLGLTYKVANNVSFTPFIGGCLGIHDAAADQLLGGIWLEVTF